MASPYFTRLLQDAEKIVTHVFPAANANVDMSSIDLKHLQEAKHPECMLKVVVPACPNFTNEDLTILLTLQDSADDATFTAVNPRQRVELTGVARTGYAGGTYYMPLPPNTRRYVNLNLLVPCGGGNNTAVTVTAGLVFE